MNLEMKCQHSQRAQDKQAGHSTICVPWLCHMCAMTLLYVCHESVMCVPWLYHMCAMTHFRKILEKKSQYSRRLQDKQATRSLICVPWLCHMCAMSLLYVCHDSVIYMCAMTLPYMCHHTSVCVLQFRAVYCGTAARLCHGCMGWLRVVGSLK